MTVFFKYNNIGIFVTDTKGVTSNDFMHGVQSLSIGDAFGIENFPDHGRSGRYFLAHTKPEVDLSIDRLLTNLPDVFGYKLENRPTSYEESLLLKPSNLGFAITGNNSTDIKQFNFDIYFNEDGETIASGTPLGYVSAKQFLLTNVDINMPNRGHFTEQLRFSGNKITSQINGTIPANDLPLYPSIVYNRKNFDKNNTILPSSIVSNVNFNEYVDGDVVYGLTNINVSLSLDYNKIATMDWGGLINEADINKWTTIDVPIGITCNFTINSRREQKLDINYAHDNFDDEQIRLVLKSNSQIDNSNEYFIIDLGKKNQLNALNYSELSTDRSILQYDFSYINYVNDFSVYKITDTNFSQAEQTTQKL